MLSISINIYNARINKGYTQQQLANMANVNRKTMVRAETTGNITVLNLLSIARALDIAASELF